MCCLLPLLTVFTLKWFLLGVDSNVLHEFTFLWKTFLTVFTLKKFLFGVSLNVLHRYTFSSFLCKTSLAKLTLKCFLNLFGVDSNVPHESIFAWKIFLTESTLRYCFSLEWVPMCRSKGRFMTIQFLTIFVWKTFLTVFTLKLFHLGVIT